jgi:molybdopterin synthase catalytic subunit
MPTEVRIADTSLEPARDLARFAAGHSAAGGIASFIGQVRTEPGPNAVLELELSHFPPLTLPGMNDLAVRALARWPLLGVLLIHRIGTIAAGEPIVLAAAAARHRREAFDAVDFAMDHLKSEAWFWKRERTAAGWRWIEPRPDDFSARARW